MLIQHATFLFLPRLLKFFFVKSKCDMCQHFINFCRMLCVFVFNFMHPKLKIHHARKVVSSCCQFGNFVSWWGSTFFQKSLKSDNYFLVTKEFYACANYSIYYVLRSTKSKCKNGFGFLRWRNWQSFNRWSGSIYRVRKQVLDQETKQQSILGFLVNFVR